MPALEPIHTNFNSVVDIGPNIALAMIVGNQIIGFFKIFLNCNIEVPIAMEITIPI